MATVHTPTELEERVARLEAAVSELKEAGTRVKGGWKSVVGIFKDDPVHAEVTRLGREYRASQGQASDPENAPEVSE